MWYWNGYPVRRVWDASGSLRVSAEKNVTVYAGQDVSDEQIFKFLDRHRRFLLTRLRRAEAWEDRFPEVMSISFLFMPFAFAIIRIFSFSAKVLYTQTRLNTIVLRQVLQIIMVVVRCKNGFCFYPLVFIFTPLVW